MPHCDDCDITVHENDLENHLKGGRHKYKVRHKSERKNVEPLFECSTCNSKFTNIDFYTIHMGSKTHKRNLRKINKPLFNKKGTDKHGHGKHGHDKHERDSAIKPVGRRVPIQGIDRYLTVDDFKEPCDYKSIREKYRPKNIKNQEGHNKTYTSSVAAYWAVTLALDPTVQDFKICLNDKEWGDFGDAVVEIQFKETTDHPCIVTTFAVQFKHISNNAKGIDSLDEGRFNCAKYISQIAKLKTQTDKENKKFVLFTTASTQPELKQSFKLKADLIHRAMKDCPCSREEKEIPVIAKTLSNRRKLLINTSDDNDNIYFFFSTDNTHTVPKLYLYTHQKKLKNFSKSTNDAVNNTLEDSKRVDIHRDFIKYIEYWSEGFLGGNYKLKKEDVLVKLGHLLLYDHKVPPHISRVIENRNFGIWNQAVNSVDVTILTKHPIIINKICEPMNMRIEKEFGVKIDTTTSTLKLTPDNINNIQNAVLKMYLFEETLGDIHDDIPMEMIYDVFWKAGMISMILRVKDMKQQDYVFQVISLLKTLGLTRRYFVTTFDQNIKTSLKYYKTLAFFVSLDDIARRLPSFFLDNVKLNVTDSFSISIKTIQDSDVFFQKKINAHEFFDMTLGRYSFKPLGNHLAKQEEEVEDAKLVLSDSMMDILREEIESKNEVNTIMDNKLRGANHWLRGINPAIFH